MVTFIYETDYVGPDDCIDTYIEKRNNTSWELVNIVNRSMVLTMGVSIHSYKLIWKKEVNND
jgi:hypothetical protein